jgi:hypothetical protein
MWHKYDKYFRYAPNKANTYGLIGTSFLSVADRLLGILCNTGSAIRARDISPYTIKGVSHVSLCMILSSIFPLALSSWLIFEIITVTPAPAQLYAQSCKATTVPHYSGTPIIGRTFGVQAKCSSAISYLTVVNEVNNTGCSTDCMSATNSTVTILDNSEKPIIVKGSSAGMTVTLGSGDYKVIPTIVSGFYEQILSPNCSGIINSGETRKCIIINSYSNNVQTWVDRLNNIKIQFSYSPPYPFVGNISQLSFQFRQQIQALTSHCKYHIYIWH